MRRPPAARPQRHRVRSERRLLVHRPRHPDRARQRSNGRVLRPARQLEHCRDDLPARQPERHRSVAGQLRLYVAETQVRRISSSELDGPGKIAADTDSAYHPGKLLYRAPGYALFDSMAVDGDRWVCQATLIEGGTSRSAARWRAPGRAWAASRTPPARRSTTSTCSSGSPDCLSRCRRGRSSPSPPARHHPRLHAPFPGSSLRAGRRAEGAHRRRLAAGLRSAEVRPVPRRGRARRTAVDLLNAAGHQQIIVLAGPGVLQAGGTEALRAFAERFDIPVATTLSGKGLLPEDHPLALGVFGYGGSRWAIDAIRSDETEILLVIGSGLSQRDTMQWDPKMLPSQGADPRRCRSLADRRTWASEVAVVGNPGQALRRLAALEDAAGLEAGRAGRRAFLERIRSRGPPPIQHRGHRERRRAHAPRPRRRRSCVPPSPTTACSASIRARTAPGSPSIGTSASPAPHYSLTNLGPMGGAIPLGIGAKLARPERPLMVATGDGCMLMHGMEVHTAARERCRSSSR